MTAFADDFDFYTVGTGDRPFGGYDSSSDPTTVAPNMLVGGSKNVIKDDNNNIVNRPGLKRFGPENSELNAVKSSYEWATSFAQNRNIWVLADGKMQVRFEDELVSIDITNFVDHTRVVFSPWWSDGYQQEALIMVNGTSNLYGWYGGMGRIASIGSTGGVSTYDTTPASGGSAYDLTSRFTINIPDGLGSGAIFAPNAIGGGIITTISSEFEPGYGYTPGTYLNVPTSTVTGPGSGLVFASVTISDQGTVTFEDSPEYGGFLSPITEFTTESLYANGTDHTYNGFTDDEFTIYGIDTTNMSVGDVVSQSIRVTPNTPSEDYTNDFIVTITNQLVVASYSSRVVSFSFDEDYETFTQGNDLISGDPDSIVLDEQPNGMIVVQESVYISAGTGSWYICTPNTPLPVEQPIGGSHTRLVIVKVEKKVGAARTAALAHEFINSIADTIIYLGQDNQLRMFGVFANILGTKYPSVSIAVKKELADTNFTGGQLRSIGDNIYLVAPVPGKAFFYQQRDDVDAGGNIVSQRLWQPPQDWNISRIAVIDDVEYGYSNQGPEAYQLWNTDQWHDDTPSGVMPYESVARWGYWQFKDRTKKGDVGKLFLEGYMPENNQLTSTLRADYLGSTAIENVVVSAAGDSPVLFTEDGVLVGDSLIGQSLVGGATGVSGLPKFRAIPQYKSYQCFEYQMELRSTEIDSRWEVVTIGSNGSQVINNPVELIKG